MRLFMSSLRTVAPVVLVLALWTGAVLAQARGPASVSELARDLSPAVVNISTSRMVGTGGMPFLEAPEGSPLQEFFDDRNPNRGLGEEALREARSLGSGFVIDPDGLIVTNNHVIDGADEILVFFTDGTRMTAELVGADDKTDLAVLKVEAETALPYVSFGDSDAAEIGDWVMAIGNPFGLGGSVTLGIVSARNRDISSGPYDNFIQTDAAINQGNSGGPLFDMDGNVVGINTAIISRTGGGLGIGFAVPGNLAVPVIDQLAEFGETRRGWLGVGIQDVSADIAASFGRDDTSGAMVVDVTEDGPSDGVLADGDIILEFDGKPIVQMRDLPRIVAETSVGKQVDVTVLRDGAEQRFTVALGRLEGSVADGGPVPPAPNESEPAPEPVPEPTGQGLNDLLGLEATPLSELSRDEFGIDPSIEGLVVISVVPGSDADDKGIRAGLVISEVNQQQVASVDDLAGQIGSAREAGRPAITLKVTDPTGASRYVGVRLE